MLQNIRIKKKKLKFFILCIKLYVEGLKNDFYHYYSSPITIATIENRWSDCVIIYIFGIIENVQRKL
jgi:hypothetical protein